MKKYDLILVALYILLLLLVWGGLTSLGKRSNKAKEEITALSERITQTRIHTVVIKNTELRVYIDRKEEQESIAIERGSLPEDGVKLFRLSEDTLYIGGGIGGNENFLALIVPDSVRIDIQEAPHVYYKE